MNLPGLIERVNLLIKQGRAKEAQSFLESHLEQDPDNYIAQYYYAYVLFQNGDNDKARKLTDRLLEADPEDEDLLNLSINIDIEDGLLELAESKAEILIENFPNDADSHLTMGRVKLAQRNYDRALNSVNTSLEFDPENLQALNLKIYLDNLLGHESTKATIEDALELDAENPSSIANHGLQLLHAGQVTEALERFKYALSIDPNNALAQMGMQEALKSKFWPYRMFYKYKVFGAKLSGKGSWTLIIGVYIGYSILRRIARSSPELSVILTPIIYLIFGLFLMTWVMDPLMNAYLLTNKYGKVLLDKDEKTMAQFCSLAVIGAVVSLILHVGFGIQQGLLLALVFGLSLIPLGSYLRPTKESNRKLTTIYTIALMVAGLGGVLLGINASLMLFFLGIFIYQWVINGILIKENARIFD